jgi:putative ABC transport system permease protein
MSSSSFYELPDNREFLLKQYDLLGNGKFPENKNEAVLVVDSSNNISRSILRAFGFDEKTEYGFDEFLGKTFKIIENDLYYQETDGVFSESAAQTDYERMYNDSDIELKIVGIMRIKENAASSMLSDGIGYTPELASFMRANAADSKIVAAQKAENEKGNNVNVLGGGEFSTEASAANIYLIQIGLVTKDTYLRQIGLTYTPDGVSIYPVNFDAKETIKAYLSEYNKSKPEDGQIIYTDLAGTVFGVMDTIINTITVVLAAIAGISLVVSSLMIGIITYVSVVERTKEIGILRSIGARKKDISRVFNAETLIIGFAAGVIGIVATLLLSIPVNIIVESIVGVTNIAALPFLYGVILIVVSMGLTFIAGLIPSRIAAKKDPVAALRSE